MDTGVITRTTNICSERSSFQAGPDDFFKMLMTTLNLRPEDSMIEKAVKEICKHGLSREVHFV